MICALALFSSSPESLAVPLIPVAERCQEFLIQAELQPDPKVISATLFHTFAIDYPFFFNSVETKRLMRSLSAQYSITSHDRYQNRVEFVDRSKVLALCANFKAAYSNYQGPLRQISKNYLESFRAESSRPGNSFEMDSELTTEDYSDLRLILKTVESHPSLKEEFLKLIENQLLTLDQWYSVKTPRFDLNSDQFSLNRSKAIKVSMKSGGVDALPTSATGKRTYTPLEKGSSDLKKVNEVFESKAWMDGEKDHSWLTHLDQDLRRAYVTLSSTSFSRLDYFRENFAWMNVYAKGADWFRSSRKTSEQKADFLFAIDQAEHIFDNYRRSLDLERYTLELAKNASKERALYLEENQVSLVPPASAAMHSFLNDSRLRAIQALGAMDGELVSMGASLDTQITKLDFGRASLKNVRAQIMTANIDQEHSEIFLKEMGNIQTAFGLDPVLPKALTKTKWGFW